jgi:hypothetical protein
MTDTQDDEYGRFLEGFGKQLNHGRQRAGQLRSRRRIATGGLALAAVAAAIIAVLSTSGGRVDVVAEAEAALAPPGQLLHIVTVSGLEMRGGTQTEVTGPDAESLGWNKPRVAEEWSATMPTRWRIATTIPTATANGSVPAAPLQCAYSNDSEETYNQGFQSNELNIVPVTRGQDEASQESLCTDQVSSGLGTEPEEQIHSMLEAGQLQPAGTSTVDGRLVLRLTGRRTESQLKSTSSSSMPPWPVEYDVDPKTYAPVRFTVEMVGTNTFGNTGTLTEVTNVTAYEQLPLDESTSALLDIKTTGNPIIHHGPNQFEELRAAEEENSESGATTATRHSRRRWRRLRVSPHHGN